MTPHRSPVSPDMLGRFDISGPRYTSFPTADRFVEAFGPEDYALALRQRRALAGARTLPLSVYVHVPFCQALCYYCACHKIITRHAEQAQKYLMYLRRELALHTDQCGRGQLVSQLHLGGGTPTFLSDDQLRELMGWMHEHFKLDPQGEYSIEVDPRTVNAQRLQALKNMGFNRLSFGVQDFDAEVQKAVHREQPAHQVFELVEQARALGFRSINIDLIYGLPRQSSASFARTLEQVNALRPDRIALYAYAHLPERFKPQRRIHTDELPAPQDKLHMLSQAIESLMAEGYCYVGMDHFALPEDGLAIAKRQGRLHRNFQGYSTQPDCDLIALGVSAIGKVGATYSQNVKTLEDYYDAIDSGQIPVQRGLALSRDDLLRRAVIMAVMCQGAVLYEPMEQAWLINFKEYFAAEMQALQELQASGLLTMDEEGFRLTTQGWFLVRAVAMVFDRYVQADRNRTRFSRII